MGRPEDVVDISTRVPLGGLSREAVPFTIDDKLVEDLGAVGNFDGAYEASRGLGEFD